MADYLSMTKPQLLEEQAGLQQQYDAFAQKGLKLDMSRGKPSPEQLDFSLGLLEMTDHIDDTGVDARNYGELEGLPETRRYFASLLGAKPEETFVAGNSSLNFMYNMVDLGWRKGFVQGEKPWKDQERIKFLCPSPGYDRHFRVTEVFGFELLIVPMTPDGPDMDIVEDLVQDEAVKGIWCIPVYSNPDGYVYSDETVRRLAKMDTAAGDFRIFWDNAYFAHHFTKDHKTCLNILDESRKAGHEDRPLMFCSTSKMTFAGAGACAMAASVANIKLASDFLFSTTICYDKINQLRHVRYFAREGGLEAHMQRHAAVIAPKFKTVIKTLHAELDHHGKIARWTEPVGGYFLSLFTLDGCARRVVELCKQAGVVLTGAGAAYPYGKDPSDNHIRIAPTYPPLDELELAAQLLCICTRMASVEKLLEIA
ncbi:MAG: aminotransferase class I/II-fold pyridoxal phosphate-dependent enzyme [Ruminococcaceae bacterium]|nr:aminotransferase class I/II-fold pyridoxal phosphate-dependent enzyme [Oscillospiraceae bacterium]